MTSQRPTIAALAATSLGTARDGLTRSIAEWAPYQQLDPGHPEHGALFRPEEWIGNAGHTGTTAFVAACVLLALDDVTVGRAAHVDESGGSRASGAGGILAAPGRNWLLERALLGADYLLRAQRDTGRIDLRNTNYDSGPDTAFAVQLTCAAIELARPRAAEDATLGAVVELLERFTLRALDGVLTGGFHTPNHRWVVAGALAQVATLFPDRTAAIEPVMRAYLAEGFDIDEEGAYIERSVGVYDTVCNRSLQLIALHWSDPAVALRARRAVAANLALDLHLLHADLTDETGLSRRQDYGTRSVPARMAPHLLLAAAWEGSDTLLHAGETLLSHSAPASLGDSVWLRYFAAKLTAPAPALPPGEHVEVPHAPRPGEPFRRLFPKNRLWRVRDGRLSASFFGGMPHLASVVYGAAELSHLEIAQSYFGPAGMFVASSLEQPGGDTGRLVLRYDGLGHPDYPLRPGYEQPLGRPVPPAEWGATRRQREVLALPPAGMELDVTAQPDGFALRLRTMGGLDGVTTRVALDFPPGGVWESEGMDFQPQAGMELFLKAGWGRMRYGSDYIEISPGVFGHRMWHMRNTQPAPHHVRVLLTFLTPIDHMLRLRVGSGPT